MLTTIYSGTAPLLTSLIKTTVSFSSDTVAMINLYQAGGVACVQTGYFVPTQTGSYVFKILFNGYAGNGCFLAINGEVKLDRTTAFTGWANSTSISLVAGQSYSFCYSVPIGPKGVDALKYSINGGADQDIQDNQIYTTTDLNSNPLYNANSILQSLISSRTPSYIAPLANIMATNVTANNRIATVPCPAVVPSISTGVLNTMENQFHCPVPVPSPVTCYRDICVMPPLKDPPPPPPPPTTSTVSGRGWGPGLRGGRFMMKSV